MPYCWNAEGIRISQGTTARTQDATLIPYEQAAARIRELLDLGRYMSNDELGFVDQIERREIANRICDAYRDDMPDARPLWDRGTYPDESGQIAYDTTVTRNGEAFDYAAFETAYNQLIKVSVSGVLPDGHTADTPHTIYTFTDVDGTMHTVSLHTYGVLHDAVAVDGHQAFYISKGAFATILE